MKKKVAHDICKRLNVGDDILDGEKNSVYIEKCRKVENLIRKSKKRVFAERLNGAEGINNKWNLANKDEGCRKDVESNNNEVLNIFNSNNNNDFFGSIHNSDGADYNNFNSTQTTARFESENEQKKVIGKSKQGKS